MQGGFREVGFEPAIGDLDGIFEGIAKVVGRDGRENDLWWVGGAGQHLLDEAPFAGLTEILLGVFSNAVSDHIPDSVAGWAAGPGFLGGSNASIHGARE